MAYLIILTVIIFISASAVGCFSQKRRQSNILFAVSGGFMAISILLSLVLKEGMFSDVLSVSGDIWLRMILAIALSVIFGVVLTLILEKKG